jgi:hypothetical protein
VCAKSEVMLLHRIEDQNQKKRLSVAVFELSRAIFCKSYLH